MLSLFFITQLNFSTLSTQRGIFVCGVWNGLCCWDNSTSLAVAVLYHCDDNVIRTYVLSWPLLSVKKMRRISSRCLDSSSSSRTVQLPTALRFFCDASSFLFLQICGRCLILLPISCYYIHENTYGRMHHTCKATPEKWMGPKSRRRSSVINCFFFSPFP